MQVEVLFVNYFVCCWLCVCYVDLSFSVFFICDRIGCIWVIWQFCLLWMLGIVIFMGIKGNLSVIYVGWFIVGFGVG